MKDRSLRYSVINGDQIQMHLPEIWKLYHGPVHQLVNSLDGGQLKPLTNLRAGININIMRPGRSEYRWHYDRSRTTAILYLNEVEGGEVEMYPNYRILLNNRYRQRAQRYLDRLLHLRLIRALFGKRKVVEPRQGRLVIMRGDRCWHSVRAVQGGVERINIISAYDVAGADFPADGELDRYLYTQASVESADPNYGR